MKKGLLVSFEGIDAIGKTLVAENFVSFLNETDRTTASLLINSKTEASIRPVIKSILFSGKYEGLTPEVRNLLFLAEVTQLTNIIVPYIESGINVVIDRYIDSTLAYPDVPSDDPILKLCRDMYTVVPDLTFLLLGRPSVCLHRSTNREESENIKQSHKPWTTIEDFKRIQSNYINNLAPESRTILIGTNNQTSEEVCRYVQDKFIEWQEKRKHTIELLAQ